MHDSTNCHRVQGRTAMRGRRGFVLLAVLSAIIGAVTLGMLVTRTARLSLLTASNRAAFLRARWNANDCAQRARAAMSESEWSRSDSAWARLDALLATAPIVREAGTCAVSLTAVGDRIDVNNADAHTLRRLFLAAGLLPTRVDSLVDALLDWLDEDDHPRPSGAESNWYRTNGRPGPRNGRLADVAELRRVRGFQDSTGFAALLDTESGRVSLVRAPAVVLAALPGFTPDLIAQIHERRAHHTVKADLHELAVTLPGEAGAALLPNIPDLEQRIAVDPDAWILTSHGRAAGSPVIAVIELRLVRAGPGAAVTRRRERWE